MTEQVERKSSGDEDLGNERWGNPEPVVDPTINNGRGRYWMVHWAGYIKDPAPTNAKLATGRSVAVYGDAPWMHNEVRLGPTAYPELPAEWSGRFVRLDRLPSAVGGLIGQRWITDGCLAAVIPEEMYWACKAVGYRDMGDLGAADPFARTPSPDLVSIVGDLEETTENMAIGSRVRVGSVWLARPYLDALRDLGVVEVRVRNDGDRDLMVIAEGVAAVMAVHVPAAESEAPSAE